ncbi:hypothetical protein LTR78_010887 [Recurvomyces mirabilis]|uniref:Chromo domain-containing protein n=1 Tax=Recurvomyces mirabilis TaxID=574656 RepID=A0AAE0WI16_9PEZI|nr:hypothetical protein LTR78_010887 [Recurvomyces mirabilis]KAK5150045.1 hypothetical protein LTS14_010410 [Recurvomyces mirabilis]
MASAVSLDKMVFYPGPPPQSTARKSFEHFAASRSRPGEAVFSISSACHQPPVNRPGAGMDTEFRIASIIAPSHGRELHPPQLLSRAAGDSPVGEAMQIPDATFSTASTASTAVSLGDNHVSLAESVVAACSSPLQIERTPTRSSVAELPGHAEKLCWDTTTSAEPGVPFRTEDTDDRPAMSSTSGVSARELSTEQPSTRFISCLSPPTFLEPGRHSDGLSPSTSIPPAGSDGSDTAWRLQKSLASSTHFQSRCLATAPTDDSESESESEAPRKPYRRLRTKTSSCPASSSANLLSRHRHSSRPEVVSRPSGPTWAVARITNSRRRGSKLYYRVSWQDTWEPADCLQGSADTALQEYEYAAK